MPAPLHPLIQRHDEPPEGPACARRRGPSSRLALLATYVFLDLTGPKLCATVRVSQRAPGHRPPVWPSDDNPQQAHLDFTVPDLDVGEEQVLALGARKAEVQPGTTFRVYLDPVGHPFCLVLDEGRA